MIKIIIILLPALLLHLLGVCFLQSNTHLNLAYQLLQVQLLLKSASERYLSLILPTSRSLSLEPARNKVYTSHKHQHNVLLSFHFLLLLLFF